MRAGALSTVITIERKSVTQNSTYGTETVTWVPLSYDVGSPSEAEQYRAQVVDILPSKQEAVQGGLAVARKLVRVRMRYRSDVTTAMRVVVHDGSIPARTLEIIGGPAELGRREGIELLCEEVIV